METPPSTPPFAVITGASRGIGAEYARALAGKGYHLLLVSRDTARMVQLASELTSCHGVAVDSEELDLAQEDAAHRLYVAARQRRPHVDLLVNNAGFGLYGEFVNMPMARVQAMLRLHVNTIVESIRLFLPAMLERRDGGVINVASIAGIYSVPYMAEYAATKAFLIAFSEALAEEVASSGVRVQACCPGSTETDFHATAGFRPKNPLRVQTPAEVVSASLSALERGPSVVMTGWQWRALAALSRCVPRRWLTRMAARSMKQRG